MQRKMQVTWVCESCQSEYIEEFERQPVDNLIKPNCLDCRRPMSSKQVVNFVEDYQSNVVRIGSLVVAENE